MQNDQGCFGMPKNASSINSEIWLTGGNSLGASGFVRRFLNVQQSTGTAFTYFSDTTNGDRIVINEPGLYFISYSDIATSAAQFAISRNAVTLAQAPNSDPMASILAYALPLASQPVELTSLKRLFPNDIIRAKSNNSTGYGANAVDVQLKIIKITAA